MKQFLLFLLLPLALTACGAAAMDSDAVSNPAVSISGELSEEHLTYRISGSADTEQAIVGLSHGFGLGTGTVAEGWLADATAFWMSQV